MNQADSILNRGGAVLSKLAGEIALINGQHVDCIIDRDPRLSPQAREESINTGVEFSRIEISKGSISRSPECGMVLTDECVVKHRIRYIKVVSNKFICECIVSNSM